MRNSKFLVLGLLIAIVTGATGVWAQNSNPITNPSFETGTGGLSGWTTYSYSVPPDGLPGVPIAGRIGPSPCPFDLLIPGSTPDGQNVCGLQARGQALNGGVYQSFVWLGGPATITLTARAYSQTLGVPADSGCRVRMGLAEYTTDDRNYVDGWVIFPWSSPWATRSVTVPGPGDYTLFIESYQPSANADNSALWDNIVFTPMPPIVVTPDPVITPDPAHPDTAVIVSWTSDIASSSEVDYGYTSEYGQIVQNSALVNNHSITVSGLTPSGTYHFRVKSSATDCVDYISDDIIFKMPIQFDSIISRISPDGLGVIVSWNTNVPTTTQVEYGLTTAYGTLTPEDANLTTSHQVTLAGLCEDTEYHFRVKGRNSPLYTDAVSADHTLLTMPSPGTRLRNGDFEDSHAGQSPSLYPWVQYTTAVSGAQAIDGIVGPYPAGGPAAWYSGAQAYSGSYFLGAGAIGASKNGGVFQRVRFTPGEKITLTTHYLSCWLGGTSEENYVQIGIDPTGGVDPASSTIKWWSSSSLASDNKWHAVAVTTTAGDSGLVTAFLEMRQQWSTELHVGAFDKVSLETPSITTIGQLKSTSGGLSGILQNEVVTYVSPVTVFNGDVECRKIYIEESDRSAGVCAYLPVSAGLDIPGVGNKITVTGALFLSGYELVLMANNWSVDSANYSVAPVAMPLASIGGITPNQPKLYGSGGACNVGLRVRVFGRVLYADISGVPGMRVEAVIDDGGNPKDKNGVPETRVVLEGRSDYGVTEGEYIVVTGVVGMGIVNYTGNPGDEIYVYRVLTAGPNDWFRVAQPGSLAPAASASQLSTVSTKTKT